MLTSTIQKWASEFRRRWEDEDDPRYGHPATATTQENIDHIHHMLMDDNAISITCERVEYCANEFGIMKISAWWVPHFLILDQKRTKLITSQENLTLFGADLVDLLECFLTQDECWVYHFETIHAVETLLLTCSKEDQGCFICREGDGLSFFFFGGCMCKRHCVY